jgi:hypothetical protein
MCLQHTHPPIPVSNVGRVKGVSLLIQNFTYFYKSKPASHKCRTVKYVLTRSSEFQQNRKETQLRGTEIPRKIKNSTPQKILSSKLAQKQLSTSRKCQVMLTNSDNIKTSKSSSETDFRKKKRIKKLILNQYTHGVGESGRSHLVEDGGESAAGRLNGRRHLLQRDGFRRNWRAAASRHGLPHLQQKRGRFVVQNHRIFTVELITTTSD